jgi:hypothetical protein
MAKDRIRSAKWSLVAYQRSPTALTAYNHACASSRDGNSTQFERLMEESLRLGPNFTPTLSVYGHHLMDKGDQRGVEYITRAFDRLLRELRSGSRDQGSLQILRRCAKTLGKTGVIEELDRLPTDEVGPDRPYSEENLVRGVGDEERPRGE